MKKKLLIWIFALILLVSFVSAETNTSNIIGWTEIIGGGVSLSQYAFRYNLNEGWQERNYQGDWVEVENENIQLYQERPGATTRQIYEYGLNQLLQTAGQDEVIVTDSEYNNIRTFDRADTANFQELASLTLGPSVGDKVKTEDINKIKNKAGITRQDVDEVIRIANSMETSAKGNEVIEAQQLLAKYLYQREEKYSEAEDILKRLRSSPEGNTQETNEILWLVLNHQGKTNPNKRTEADGLAVQIFDRDSVQGQLARGRMALSDGKINVALKHFKDAEDIGKDRLEELQREADYEIHTTPELILIRSQIRTAYLEQGNVFYETGKYDEAIEAYGQVLEFDTGNQEIKNLIALSKVGKATDLWDKNKDRTRPRKEDLDEIITLLDEATQTTDFSHTEAFELYTNVLSKTEDNIVREIEILNKMKKIAVGQDATRVQSKIDELQPKIQNFNIEKADQTEQRIAQLNDQIEAPRFRLLSTEEQAKLRLELKAQQEKLEIIDELKKGRLDLEDVTKALKNFEQLDLFAQGIDSEDSFLSKYKKLQDKINNNPLYEGIITPIDDFENIKDRENVLEYIEKLNEEIEKLERIEATSQSLKEIGLTNDQLSSIEELENFDFSRRDADERVKTIIVKDFKKVLNALEDVAQDADENSYEVTEEQAKKLQFIGLQSNVDDRKEVLRILLLSENVNDPQIAQAIQGIIDNDANLDRKERVEERQMAELKKLFELLKTGQLELDPATRAELMRSRGSSTSFFKKLKEELGAFDLSESTIRDYIQSENAKELYEIEPLSIAGEEFAKLTDRDGIVYLVPFDEQVKDRNKYKLPTGKVDGHDVLTITEFIELIEEGAVPTMLTGDQTYDTDYRFALRGQEIIKPKTGDEEENEVIGWKVRTGPGGDDFSTVVKSNNYEEGVDGYDEIYFDSKGNVFNKRDDDVRKVVGLLYAKESDSVAQENFQLGFGFSVYEDENGDLWRQTPQGGATRFDLAAYLGSGQVEGGAEFLERYQEKLAEKKDADLKKEINMRRRWQRFLGTLVNGPTGYYKSFSDKINAELGWEDEMNKYLDNAFFKTEEWEEWICANIIEEGYPEDLKLETDKQGNKIIAMTVQGRKDEMPDSSLYYEFSWLVRPQNEDYLYTVCAGKCDSSCKLLETETGDIYQDIAVPAGETSSGFWAGYSNKTVSTVSICYIQGGRRNIHDFVQPITHKDYNPDEDSNRYINQDPERRTQNDPEAEGPVSSVPQGANFL